MRAIINSRNYTSLLILAVKLKIAGLPDVTQLKSQYGYLGFIL